ncbi:MAG TPA: zinc-binding alcohol dehydrogenase [Jiangellales bacterium]|nr:zinc-binding alcohol dehydrogenase [Jiangellales bacterium]
MGGTAGRAEAFWVAAPGRGEIRPEELPEPGPGDVLVRTLWSGVSRGTESTIFLGRVPASVRDQMRAPFQVGEPPGPVKYGYLSVGLVERGPPALVGREVFCLYPHQTRYVVPAAAVHPLPENLPASRAVLAGNAETAVNALWDAGPRIGDRLTVVGAGVVGSLVAALAAGIPGAAVQLVDVDPRRAAVATALGAEFRAPDDADGGRDLVVHASGTEQGLALALSLLGREGEVVELSWYGDRPVTVPLGEHFHPRRLTIRSSQVGTVAPARAARRTTADRMRLALELLRDPALDVLVSGESPFRELPDLMLRLAAGGSGALCHRIRYGDG